MTETAQRLRRDFDSAFSRPSGLRERTGDELVEVEARGERYALRLAQVGALFAAPAVRPVPGPFAELLGLAGYRGTLVPVFDLAALLGRPGSTSPGWVALHRGADAVAFAFDRFVGQLQEREVEALASGPASGHRFVSGAMRRDGALVPVVDLGALVSEISRRVQALAAPEGL